MQHHDNVDCNINQSLKHPLLLCINHIKNRSKLIMHKHNIHEQPQQRTQELTWFTQSLGYVHND